MNNVKVLSVLLFLNIFGVTFITFLVSIGLSIYIAYILVALKWLLFKKIIDGKVKGV